MSPQYGELRPLAAGIVSLVWGTPGNFSGFRVLAALLHGTLVVGVSQTAALNRGRYLYLAGWPSRWAFAHISCLHYNSIIILCGRYGVVDIDIDNVANMDFVCGRYSPECGRYGCSRYHLWPMSLSPIEIRTNPHHASLNKAAVYNAVLKYCFYYLP